MTLSRLRESREVHSTQAHAQARVETRGLPTWPTGSGGTAYSIIDPAAVPPPNLGRRMRAGVLVTENTLLQVDVVFTALRIITTAILKMGNPRAYTEDLSADNIPFRRYLKDQPRVLSDTWGGRLMQYDGLRRTIMSMALFQEAFWYVLATDRLVRPEALDVLHPAYMEIKADKQDNPVYIYGPQGKRRELDRDRVIHIPFMALPQERRSLKTVEHLGISAALAMAALEFGATWFSQGAAPSFLLSTEKKLGQEELERIADKFQVQHAGLPNAHLPLVMDNGLKSEKISANPDEAMYLQTLEYGRSVIASWFGVDELIPNALQRQTPAAAHTAQERMQRFVTLTLSGYTVPLEEAFSLILPEEQKAAFLTDDLLQPDPQFLAGLIEAMRNTQVAPPNEIRGRVFKWPPLDDPVADQASVPLASNVSPDSPGQKPQGEPKPKDEGT